MPNISTNKEGGVIRWDGDDWLSGLIPDWDLSNLQNRVVGKGFSYSVGIDPFRHPGYAMPGFQPADVTNVSVATTLAKSGVLVGQYAYTIGGARINQLDVTSNTLTTPTTFPRTIPAHGGHSTVLGSDIAVYHISGTRTVFYSWSDNTDGDIGTYNLASTFDEDYMSTVPTGMAALDTTNPHPLFVASNDIMYIGDGRNLHQYDGATTTLTKNRLILPRDYIITSITETRNYLVVFAYKASGVSSSSFYRSEAKAFFWDKSQDDPTYRVDLRANYVNGAFIYDDNIVGCFVEGPSGTLNGSKTKRLLIGNESGFKTVASFIDAIPGHGGVEAFGGVVYWNSAGIIYQYGSPFPGYPAALNKITSGSGTTGEGMLKMFFNNTLIASTGTTTSGGLQAINSNFYESSFYVPFASIPFPENKRARISDIRCYWRNTASGGRTINFFLNYGRGATQRTIINGLGTITNLITNYRRDASEVDLSSVAVEDISFNVTYGTGSGATVAPILKTVEIYYKYSET